ncbi:N-acetylmuramoyl-L-alanine amidase family protein, partial [Lactonifactor longoviformis]
WYYLKGNGSMATGWQLIGNTWYYLKGNGAMVTGWQLIGSTWYYLRDNGAMATGWIQLGNTWYYLKSSGSMASDEWIGNYYVDKSGAWIPNKARGKLIAIDAGHQLKGNSEKEPIGPGASVTKAKVTGGAKGTATGLYEYELNLQVSLKLRDELKARGYEVYMIRETNNVNISNAERAKMAARAGADILVRIHANSDSSSSANGALTIAPSKNNPYIKGLVNDSRRLSQNILDSFCAATGAKNRGILTSDEMSGINWSTVPVTIVEMGFMSNASEDRRMADAGYQKKMAKGIADGIDKYFN